jgi:hypothetical protein
MAVTMRKIGGVAAVVLTSATIGLWAKSAPVTTHPGTTTSVLASTAAMSPFALMRAHDGELPTANYGDPF